MDEKVIMTDATVSATKQTLIEMAERAWLDLYGRGHNQLGFVESLNRFASLVRRDERNSWPKRPWVGLTDEEITEARQEQNHIPDARKMVAAQLEQKPWIGLTDEEIMRIGKNLGAKLRLGGNPNIDFDYARVIEAQLKEKNT